MSTVNELSRMTILAYPDFVKSRADVLALALCVPSNGYKWNDKGEVEGTMPMEPWTPETMIDTYKNLLPDEEAYAEAVRNGLGAVFQKTIASCSGIVDNIDVLMDAMPELAGLYPQNDLALIMNAPENITPEWQEAVNEMQEIAKGFGWSFDGTSNE